MHADGHVIEKTGSFAQTKLPQPVTGNTFNADNETTAFNSTAMTGACPERSRGNANGNLTADASNTYAWDARNHLSAISGGASASFVYDPFGRRMSKTIGAMATSFLYDELNPVQELQAGAPSANLLTGLGIDEYFQRTDASGASSYLTDALGSTLALANPAGGLATSYTYDPFGNTAVAGSSTNPFQFTSRENDGTGLYFNRARYYSPSLGRFISQDPMDFGAGDVNLYGYVANSPASDRDPLGPYGTASCAYYREACSADGGIYNCYLAQEACQKFPSYPNETSGADCIRQCLQEKHYSHLPEPNSCSSSNQPNVPDITGDHLFCILRCAQNPENPYDTNGAPLPDKNPSRYQSPDLLF